MQPRTVQVVTVIAGKDVVVRGTCKWCRARILWAQRASEPGRPSKALPFELPRPWPLSHTENPDTGIVVETWPLDKMHLLRCPHKHVQRFRPFRTRGRVHA